MTEQTTRTRGRLAAAVIASSTLAFSSFIIGVPAALADEDPEAVGAAEILEVQSELAEDDVADDTSTSGDGEDSGPADEENTEPADDEAPSQQPETSEEPQPESPEEETPDAAETFAAPTVEPFNANPEDTQVEPLVSINPASGPAGSDVMVHGWGFTPNGVVEVSLVSATSNETAVSETVTADEEGTIVGTELTIPDGTATGIYHVNARDDDSDTTAPVADFNVTDVQLTIEPETLSADDFQENGVTLSVEGLEPNQTVEFEFGNRYSPIPSLEGEATADENGTATYTAVAGGENVYVGSYRVTVRLSGGGVQVAYGNFEVTSELPQVNAFPHTPTEDGAVRQDESLIVEGYNATEDNTVTVDYGIEGVDEEQLDTNSLGEFFKEFTIPQDTEPGVKQLTVTNDHTGAVGTTEYTVATIDDEPTDDETDDEITEPTLKADRNQILLTDFVGDPDDEPGVHFTVEGLEAYTDITYTAVAPGAVEGVDEDTSADAEGFAQFFIFGYDYVSDPTVYLGDYSVTVTYQDETGEPQELGPVTFSVVEELVEGPRIVLESNEVYQGGELEVSVTNLTPEGDVTVEWNPTETMTADANGALEATLAIADDAETGTQQLTVRDESSGASNSVEYTVLEAEEGVTGPALTIDPETITLEDFIGDEDDGAGVVHVVKGLEPGAQISYVVSGPENVNDHEDTETAEEDGAVRFAIYGAEVPDLSVYLGEYTTVVTYETEDGETAELSGSFTVVTGDDDPVGSADGDDDEVAPAGATSGDLNGTNLAQTGATGVQLGLLAGLLLLAGGAFVVFANRARLFPRKA